MKDEGDFIDKTATVNHLGNASLICSRRRSQPTRLRKEELFALIKDAQHQVTHKIDSLQGGIPTFFDNFILGLVAIFRALAEECGSSPNQQSEDELWDAMNMIREYIELNTRPRFVPFEQRAEDSRKRRRFPWELQRFQIAGLQGIYDCLRWRGIPVFKSVFDFAIYPMMLWEIRPGSIVELGSGGGGSAVWLCDLLKLLELRGRVVSVDIRKPSIEFEGVDFLKGDCNRIESVLHFEFLDQLSHPWIVIEDAHVNTAGVLRYIRRFLQKGDYVIVEDSENKTSVLTELMREFGSEFLVDTKYTDFFGRNATCSKDSVFVRA